MARESALWNWLSDARPKLGPGALHILRIENMLEAGTPDVEGYLKLPDCEGQFWLELKSSERPARSITPIRFKLRNREAQIEWIKRRWSLGANAFWLLQVGSGHDRILYLAPGSLGAQLKRGLTESELAIECLRTGVFTKPFSQERILRKAVSCRKSKYQSPP